MYAHTKTRQLVAFTAIAAVTLCIWHVLPTAVADRPNQPPPDTTPPAAVTTLAAATGAQGSISLTWRSVGDDGGGPGACSGAGTASSYDVRYSTVSPADPPFNGNLSAWFAAAAPAAGESAPQSCDRPESLCLSGLNDAVVYHVALKVSDEAGNTSAVSNVASAAAGALLGDVMHVSGVGAGWIYAGGVKKRPIHSVYIQDEFGAPVEGATVTVDLSGCTSESGLLGVTDCTGRARIVGNRTATCHNTQCCFVVAVTNVSHPALLYDAPSNAANCASSACNPFGGPCTPTPCE